MRPVEIGMTRTGTFDPGNGSWETTKDTKHAKGPDERLPGLQEPMFTCRVSGCRR